MGFIFGDPIELTTLWKNFVGTLSEHLELAFVGTLSDERWETQVRWPGQALN